MSSDSSSQPAAYSTTTTSDAPWSSQQPYLQTGFEKAQSDVLNKPMEYYPNSTVVPFAQQTEQALGMQEQRALSGSPVTDAAQGMATDTLSGNYLSAGNPYFSNAVNAATRPMVETFQEDVMPAIQSGFSGAGRYGSGLQARQQGRAGEGLIRQVGDVAGSMASDNYNAERQRQLQAGTLAPTLASQDYTDIANLADVGATREAQAGGNLQEDINRFQQGQQAPLDALTNYMALIKGGYGSDSTSTSPIYRNKNVENMGLATSAAGIAGTLWGKDGIWG